MADSSPLLHIERSVLLSIRGYFSEVRLEPLDAHNIRKTVLLLLLLLVNYCAAVTISFL